MPTNTPSVGLTCNSGTPPLELPIANSEAVPLFSGKISKAPEPTPVSVDEFPIEKSHSETPPLVNLSLAPSADSETWSSFEGEVVPIPTLPSGLIWNLSAKLPLLLVAIVKLADRFADVEKSSVAVAVSVTPATLFDGANPNFAELPTAVVVERMKAVVLDGASIKTGSDELWTTWNFVLGEAVPIPTAPVLKIVKLVEAKFDELPILNLLSLVIK